MATAKLNMENAEFQPRDIMLPEHFSIKFGTND